MINIEIQDEKAEAKVAKYLKPKVTRFGEKFNINTSVGISNFHHKIYLWLGIEKEELNQKKTIDELSKYLRIKQWYAQELRKRAQAQADRFESYDIVIDMLVSYLENKPIKDTTSIPSLEEIESTNNQLAPSLEDWDKVALRELKEAVIKINEEKENDTSSNVVNVVLTSEDDIENSGLTLKDKALASDVKPLNALDVLTSFVTGDKKDFKRAAEELQKILDEDD